MKRLILSIKLLVLFLTYSFFAYVIMFVWFLAMIPTKVRLTDGVSDAIVVLTGDKYRVSEGIKLLREKKYAKKLFISGVGQDTELAHILKGLNLDNSEGIYFGRAHNTGENASETLKWIKDNDIKKIVLVTSDYHVPRSIEIFSKVMPDVNILIHPIIEKNKDMIWYKRCFKEFNKIALIKLHIKSAQ